MAHAGGRPLKFSSVEILQKLIDKYFIKCDEFNKPYTVTGLAVELDCDRRTLINYEKSAEFFPTIKRAKTKIEAYAEESLHTAKNVNGISFSLRNNFGWVDKTEVKQDITVNASLDSQLMEGRQNLRKKLEENNKPHKSNQELIDECKRGHEESEAINNS